MRVSTLVIVLAVLGGIGYFIWKGGYIDKMQADTKNTFSYHYNAGQSLYQTSKYDEAIKEFEAALAINAKDSEAPNAIVRMGDCYKEKKEPAKALECYERCLKEFPDYKLRGQVEQSIEKVKALKHF
jgi:tetratricopeptide (TPR) repeat protein